MSRMMDNLARVQDEEAASRPAEKPSLFVVKENPPVSSVGGPGGHAGRKKFVVWAVVASLMAGLGVSFFRGQRSMEREAAQERAAPAPGPVAEAASLISSGRMKEALASIESTLRSQPGHFAARMNQAYVTRELGRSEEAIQFMKAIVQAKPGSAVAHNNLGAFYLRAGKFTEAETSLRQAVDLDPAFFEARVNLAAALEQQRDWAGALKIFEEILASNAAGPEQASVRERVRRLRSLAVAAATPKENL